NLQALGRIRRQRIWSLFVSIFMLLGTFWLAPAQAELVIEITQGSREAIPIAVVPFANRTGAALPEDVGRIVADDLERTGQFTPLDQGKMLSLPSSANEVFVRDWRLLGQRYLLIGSLEAAGAGQFK